MGRSQLFTTHNPINQMLDPTELHIKSSTNSTQPKYPTQPTAVGNNNNVSVSKRYDINSWKTVVHRRCYYYIPLQYYKENM